MVENGLRNNPEFVFFLVRSIGIIPQSQSVSLSSSESEMSETSAQQPDVLDVEPEISQDHYASPSLRQSARDGAKVIACFGMFLFLFITPFNCYSSSRSTGNDIWGNVFKNGPSKICVRQL